MYCQSTKYFKKYTYLAKLNKPLFHLFIYYLFIFIYFFIYYYIFLFFVGGRGGIIAR